jgi:hypothetical protein
MGNHRVSLDNQDTQKIQVVNYHESMPNIERAPDASYGEEWPWVVDLVLPRYLVSLDRFLVDRYQACVVVHQCRVELVWGSELELVWALGLVLVWELGLELVQLLVFRHVAIDKPHKF